MHTTVQHLKKRFSQTAGFTRLLAALPERGELAVTGLAGSAKSLCCALLAEAKPVVAVARDAESATALCDDLELLNETNPPVLFDLRRHIEIDKNELRREIISAVVPILSRAAHPVIVAPDALGVALPNPAAMRRSSVALQTGGLVERDNLVAQLVRHGYQRKDFVAEEGDFAVRGGIIDIFPFAQRQPARIELRDIEIESIRSFDLISQRSIRPLPELLIALGLPEAGKAEADGNEFTATALDYAPAGALLFIDEPEIVLGRIEDAAMRERLLKKIEGMARIAHSVSARAAAVDFGGRPQPHFGGAVKRLALDIAEKTEAGIVVDVFAETNEHAARLTALLEETDEAGALPPLHVRSLALAEGFVLPADRWCVYTEHEVFARNRSSRRPPRESFRGITLRELRKLHHGDYVVHVEKGIGRFAGLETIEIQGAIQESVKLIYRDQDVLYVHLNHIDRLQKYVSKEGKVPQLSKLGTMEWERAKQRMKARATEIAAKLLRIHARRKTEPGTAFSHDTRWQRELEASFLYEDTPDQQRATQDVKRDMETPHPMDRLICGDVGYGKTEVAVRAAFKAIQDGAQAAVLVPTTILAQQHFNTFRDRLEKYAVRVAVLSRFKSRAEQKTVIAELADGVVDVVIGTHRLLSKDVVFKNLGLLIIDEEHRFGVAAKEKLREKRSTVDTLTLTATPIPRTMNLALAGVLDISVIETPPPNRRPIQTGIVQWDAETIRKAVMYEIGRGGQCFVVHDHVQDIAAVAARIHDAAPEARIAIAHGQMPNDSLEGVMMDFMMKKYDVLVCTKIVESGLDIPSVNTILISNAERFGLAELYQLRGRVGRSNVQAYAYLIVPPPSVLATQALKRLYALEEFTDLGSGFQLAMRDLELRGAGTILGGDQSGFIDALGFELYNQLLEQAVRELKEQEYAGVFAVETQPRSPLLRRDVQVTTGADALIPASYVADDAERFDMYKRLYRADTSALRRIRDEMLDRFGAPPPQTEALFSAIRLKNAAGALGFDKVAQHNGEVTLELSEQDAAADEFYRSVFPPLMQWVSDHPTVCSVTTKGNMLRLTIALRGAGAVETVESLRGSILEVPAAANAAAQ